MTPASASAVSAVPDAMAVRGLSPAVSPFADLLDISPDEIARRYRDGQRTDFRAAFDQLKRDGGLPGVSVAFAEMMRRYPDNPIWHTADIARMTGLFEQLHEHVIAHPVWLHPFFRRFHAADMTRDQALSFTRHYLNQIKNTRQCVALACGRFYSLTDLPFGPVNEPVSELVQNVLATLLADEYGTEAHGTDHHDDRAIAEAVALDTHIVLFRRMFALFGQSYADQDCSFIPEIADNILTQRALAGDPRFSNLESLASVGLGMEWGVPTIFSLLLGGMIKLAEREGIDWTPADVAVLSGHVHQDVGHGVLVMLTSALLIETDEDMSAVRNAVNALMSARYEMMSGLYRAVFEEPCASVGEIDLPAIYRVSSSRFDEALRDARRRAVPDRVIGAERWQSDAATPFVPAF